MVTRKTQKLINNAVVIALLAIGIVYVCSRFIHLGSVEYTDNAQVKQHITPVNTRVQGFIRKICFEEYKPVHKGDTLLVIEDAEFKLRLAQAAEFFAQDEFLMDRTMACRSEEEVRTLFGIEASEYWRTHFIPGAESDPRPKRIGAFKANIIGINLVVDPPHISRRPYAAIVIHRHRPRH